MMVASCAVLPCIDAPALDATAARQGGMEVRSIRGQGARLRSDVRRFRGCRVPHECPSPHGPDAEEEVRRVDVECCGDAAVGGWHGQVVGAMIDAVVHY